MFLRRGSETLQHVPHRRLHEFHDEFARTSDGHAGPSHVPHVQLSYVYVPVSLGHAWTLGTPD